jgi:hypothetical protein
MPDHRPTFNVQTLDDRLGYAVVATRPDEKSERLVGVYLNQEYAEQWIRERSAIWLRSRVS